MQRVFVYRLHLQRKGGLISRAVFLQRIDVRAAVAKNMRSASPSFGRGECWLTESIPAAMRGPIPLRQFYTRLSLGSEAMYKLWAL
jgi:hypothetical protein